MLSGGPNVAKYAFEGGPAETVASLNRGLVNVTDLTEAIGNIENAENVVQVLGALTGASISFAKIHDTTLPDLYNSAKKIDVNESSGGGGSSSGGKPPKGGKNSFKVNYNGAESPVYRGGNDFTVKSNEIKINPQTGNVRTSHGVSLDVNPETISRFGGAYRIETIPKGLKIIQRGGRAEHFEIVPAYEMPLKVFQDLLNQITITGPY